MSSHRHWMALALAAAREAGEAGEVPVGAVLIGADGALVTRGANRRERDCDPTAHAELVVLRTAGQKLGDWQLHGCTLYVTLEPCPMCASVIVQARIDLLVYGADDPKAGAVGSVLDLTTHPISSHRPAVIAGVEADACRQLLRDWFASQRQR